MFCSKSRRNGPATSFYPQYERTRTWWFANRGKSSIIETPCFRFVKRAARCRLNRMWRHISVDDPNTKKVPGVAECSPPPLARTIKGTGTSGLGGWLLILPYPNYYIYLLKNWAIPESVVALRQIYLRTLCILSERPTGENFFLPSSRICHAYVTGIA